MIDKDDPRLTTYLLDEMSAEERIDFEKELASQPELQEHLQQLESAGAALTSAFAAESNVPAALSDEQRQAIVAESAVPVLPPIDTDVQPKLPEVTGNGIGRWAIVGGVATVAALCVVAVGVYPRFLGNHEGAGTLEALPRVAMNKNRSENGDSDGVVEMRSATSYLVEEDILIDDVLDTTALATDFSEAPNTKAIQDQIKDVNRLSRMELARRGSRVDGRSRINRSPSDNFAAEAEFLEREEAEFTEDFESDDVALSGERTLSGEGKGPGNRGEQYEQIQENDFFRVLNQPKSTFSIDVDTASYSKIRQYLFDYNRMPSPNAVRIEEMVNYFTYDYKPPTDDKPFSAAMEISQCPWNAKHRLARIAIKGKEIDLSQRKSSNIVFLLDVSGSMGEPNKLPLVKSGMKMLVDELCENDKVSIVVYAGAAGLVLPPTRGDKKEVIMSALDRLHAGGSTNGGAGIELAYQTALDNFVKGGTNRVMLCTDGDFNVGQTAKGDLADLAAANAKSGVYLSVLGFGMGNLNDPMLEEITNKGNGNYFFIDSKRESRKVLVEQMTGTLITIAKDVKIQVEFNPNQVQSYRLIGYENRVMANRDFNDDTKDAGEIGAGHTVTAFYELIPVGVEDEVVDPKDELRYQTLKTTKLAKSKEAVFLRLRYKDPEATDSKLLEFAVKDEGKKLGEATKDFRFATAVAGFGMVLRNSKYKGDLNCDAVLEIAGEAATDEDGAMTEYRQEFLDMVRKAKELGGK
jgi:Ca-activated chloride channel family protein